MNYLGIPELFENFSVIVAIVVIYLPFAVYAYQVRDSHCKVLYVLVVYEEEIPKKIVLAASRHVEEPVFEHKVFYRGVAHNAHFISLTRRVFFGRLVQKNNFVLHPGKQRRIFRRKHLAFLRIVCREFARVVNPHAVKIVNLAVDFGKQFVEAQLFAVDGQIYRPQRPVAAGQRHIFGGSVPQKREGTEKPFKAIEPELRIVTAGKHTLFEGENELAEVVAKHRKIEAPLHSHLLYKSVGRGKRGIDLKVEQHVFHQIEVKPPGGITFVEHIVKAHHRIGKRRYLASALFGVEFFEPRFIAYKFFVSY